MKLKQQEVIVDEFENECYAEIANRDLELTRIKTNIIKNDNDVFIFFSDAADEVQLVIPGIQVEKTKK